MKLTLAHVELFRLAFDIKGHAADKDALDLANRMLQLIGGKPDIDISPPDLPKVETETAIPETADPEPAPDPTRNFKPGYPNSWTPEMIQNLKKWWAEGLSAAEIGRRVGKTGPAVATKASELKLGRRSKNMHADPPTSRRCPGCNNLFVTRDPDQRICPTCL